MAHRNLKIRGNTDKYLKNLGPYSACYDPESRWIRECPYPSKYKTYMGGYFVRATDDTPKVGEEQLEAPLKTALPTRTEGYKEFSQSAKILKSREKEVVKYEDESESFSEDSINSVESKEKGKRKNRSMAKHPRILVPYSEYCGPKSRWMRKYPYPSKYETDMGGYFVRATTKHGEEQLEAPLITHRKGYVQFSPSGKMITGREKGVVRSKNEEVSESFSKDSVTAEKKSEKKKKNRRQKREQMKQKAIENKKDQFKSKVQGSILEKYGGEEQLEAPPKTALLTRTEVYVELFQSGKLINCQEKEVVRSKDEEASESFSKDSINAKEKSKKKKKTRLQKKVRVMNQNEIENKKKKNRERKKCQKERKKQGKQIENKLKEGLEAEEQQQRNV